MLGIGEKNLVHESMEQSTREEAESFKINEED